MNILLTSDWHLDAKPAHEYRWEIFDRCNALARNGKVDLVVVAGDIVDAKDRHTAKMVSKLVSELQNSASICPWIVMMGNHCYVDDRTPFFQFVEHIENVDYILTPEVRDIDGAKVGFIPHSRSWQNTKVKPTNAITAVTRQTLDLLICHQTFRGSVGENGTALEGMSLDFVDRDIGTVVSGDVHVPQTIGQVTYCGAPHPVRMGDHFSPRLLVWNTETKELTSHHNATIRRDKLLLKHDDGQILDRSGRFDSLRPGDHCRAIIELDRSYLIDTQKIRQEVRDAIEAKKVRIFGIEVEYTDDLGPDPDETKKDDQLEMSPEDTIREHCAIHKLAPAYLQVGLELLNED